MLEVSSGKLSALTRKVHKTSMSAMFTSSRSTPPRVHLSLSRQILCIAFHTEAQQGQRKEAASIILKISLNAQLQQSFVARAKLNKYPLVRVL